MSRRKNDDDPFGEERLANSQYPDFGRKVREILRYGKEDQISNREASALTKVNYVTISTMANGVQPEIGTIVKFATKMDPASLNELLRLADYKPLKFNAEVLERNGMIPEDYQLINIKTNKPVYVHDKTDQQRTYAEKVFSEAVENQVRQMAKTSDESKQDIRDRIFKRLSSQMVLTIAATPDTNG